MFQSVVFTSSFLFWSQNSFEGHFLSALTDVFHAVILQTDVQKILRNARKLPDKTQTFYKVNLAENESTMIVFII